MKPVGAWCHQLFKCVVGDDDDLGDGGCHSGVHQITMEKKHHVFFSTRFSDQTKKRLNCVMHAAPHTHTHTFNQHRQKNVTFFWPPRFSDRDKKNVMNCHLICFQMCCHLISIPMPCCNTHTYIQSASNKKKTSRFLTVAISAIVTKRT